MFTEGRGSQVIWGVADYWVSRVTWSSAEQKYHVLGDSYKTLIRPVLLRSVQSFNMTEYNDPVN